MSSQDTFPCSLPAWVTKAKTYLSSSVKTQCWDMVHESPCAERSHTLICAHTCAHTCMLAHTHMLTIHTHTHTHVHMHICTHACMHAPSGSAHFSKGSQEANSTCQVQQQLEQQLTSEAKVGLEGGTQWLICLGFKEADISATGQSLSTRAGGRFLNKMVW